MTRRKRRTWWDMRCMLGERVGLASHVLWPQADDRPGEAPRIALLISFDDGHSDCDLELDATPADWERFLAALREGVEIGKVLIADGPSAAPGHTRRPRTEPAWAE